MEKDVNSNAFCEKNEDVGGLGHRQGQGWSHASKKEPETVDWLTSGRSFWSFFFFFATVFLVYFLARSFSALLVVFGPKGSQKGGFGRPFRGHVGGRVNM